ncbi:MAG: heavy metal translocating P-type ATPase metal-binding domain-containing protein [Bacteroidia bacterium]
MLHSVQNKILCYHCGDDCPNNFIAIDDKLFCCEGCKLVYEILQENNLCTYYNLYEKPGIKTQAVTGNRFNFLDEVTIQQKLISFKNRNEIHITFHIPEIHCSSCIWLLENFQRVDKGVIQSKVNFLKKEVYFVYDETKTSLRKIVEALTSVGYEPSIHLDSIEKKEKRKTNRDRIIRIGIAGFCFGNIMMLSFPEYFSSGNIVDAGLKSFFSYLILLLSLPVFFYSASEFFVKSYQSLKQKTTSIDVPIALGIAAIFIRSSYEIISHTGAGYFDSGSGLIFFMLIGRWFQDYTFDALSFERDYKSYFPVAVTTLKKRIEKSVAVNDLKINDIVLIRNNEIIPVDGTLIKGNAHIDYSFVTGESLPVYVKAGEFIFAGGKQTGSIIELIVTKEISQSHLTQLWNNDVVKSHESKFEKLVKAISRYFIVVTLLIASIAAVYWWNIDVRKAVNAFTAVLVIACPCALALSAPFTYGNILRILGKKKIFLRNYHVVERLADINTIVFDKTGTLTENNSSEIKFVGEDLNEEEQQMIFSLARHSSHPLSKLLAKHFIFKTFLNENKYQEIPGQGITAIINDTLVKAGSDEFILGKKKVSENNFTKVYVSFNEECKGYFVFKNNYRFGLKELAHKLLKNKFRIAVLSGDNNAEKTVLENLLSKHVEMRFDESPSGKLDYINFLHEKKFKVMMIGDGLNDAGALRHSDVGISIADNTNNFTPASDAIMDSSQLENLYKLIAYSKSASHIIIWSFIISLLYNFIGLSFAVTGTLSPLTAAILMPISTVSLVLFTVIASTVKGIVFGFK